MRWLQLNLPVDGSGNEILSSAIFTKKNAYENLEEIIYIYILCFQHSK
jgi:hypothetical protein